MHPSGANPTRLLYLSLAAYNAADHNYGRITVRRKFPALCRAIQAKIDDHNASGIEAMGHALTVALTEDPPPSLAEMCRRLGYCRSVVLRGHFSELCDQLVERRRAYRVREIEKLRTDLKQFSLDIPAVSLESACRRVGLSRQQLLRLCPVECAAIVAHYDHESRETAQRKVQELYSQARQIVARLHAEGKLPSVKRINALFGRTLSRSWSERTAAIRAAKAELPSGPPDSPRPSPKDFGAGNR